MHNVHIGDRLESAAGIVIWNSIYTYFHMNRRQPLAHSYRWSSSICDSKKKKKKNKQQRSPNRSFNWYILHFGLSSKNNTHTKWRCCCYFCHCRCGLIARHDFFPSFILTCAKCFVISSFVSTFWYSTSSFHFDFFFRWFLFSFCHKFVSNSSFLHFIALSNVPKGWKNRLNVVFRD